MFVPCQMSPFLSFPTFQRTATTVKARCIGYGYFTGPQPTGLYKEHHSGGPVETLGTGLDNNNIIIISIILLLSCHNLNSSSGQSLFRALYRITHLSPPQSRRNTPSNQKVWFFFPVTSTYKMELTTSEGVSLPF